VDAYVQKSNSGVVDIHIWKSVKTEEKGGDIGNLFWFGLVLYFWAGIMGAERLICVLPYCIMGAESERFFTGVYLCFWQEDYFVSAVNQSMRKPAIHCMIVKIM